jgi:16S rRNA (uracil1498-N3)-methyltransferase
MRKGRGKARQIVADVRGGRNCELRTTIRPMPLPRFFHDRRDDTVELRGPEAHHLSGVLRLRPGDRVELFDGAGFAAEAEILDVVRGRAKLRSAGWRERRERELPGDLVLVSALPKGRRLDWLLEKAVELGAAAFAPLAAERSVRRAKARDDDDPGFESIRRTFVEAAKQCGRNVVPAVLSAATAARLAVTPGPGLRVFGKPGAPAIAQRASAFGPVTTATVVIGPEGGLTDEEERTLTAAGFAGVGLAPAVLRIETAAAAALAQLGPWMRAGG